MELLTVFLIPGPKADELMKHVDALSEEGTVRYWTTVPVPETRTWAWTPADGEAAKPQRLPSVREDPPI